MWMNGEMSKKHFLFWTCVAIVGITAVIIKPDILPFIKDYQSERIVIWKKILLDQDLTKSEKIGNARQSLQSLYAVGSGGLMGKGFGMSGQKISNLSEKANDFIFAVIGEELGFIRSFAIMLIYALLVWRGFYIGNKSKSMFGKMVCYGISVQMALQVLINISVATALLPNTGISLPFFSDGGSSMIFTMFSMGAVLAVSRENVLNETKRRTEKNEE